MQPGLPKCSNTELRSNSDYELRIVDDHSLPSSRGCRAVIFGIARDEFGERLFRELINIRSVVASLAKILSLSLATLKYGMVVENMIEVIVVVIRHCRGRVGRSLELSRGLGFEQHGGLRHESRLDASGSRFPNRRCFSTCDASSACASSRAST